MKVRDWIDQSGGSFAKALVLLYDEPTFDHLMDAYTLADKKNRGRIDIVSYYAGLMPLFPGTTDLDMSSIHELWLKIVGDGGRCLIKPLRDRFTILARLEEDVEAPWEVPL